MEECGYLTLIRKIIKDGEIRKTRNAKVLSLFGESLSFNLTNNFPILTTKKMNIKNIFEELIFFLRGETDTKILEAKGVKIWKPNTTREFLDSRNLDYEVGDMGPMYGFMWNHFGAEYKGCKHEYTDQGTNQVDNCIDLIKNDPTSRRIIITALDPSNLDKMVLAPCHCMIQFYVRNYKGEQYLDGQMYQRSADLMLGVPYNIASYSLLIIMIARYCGIKPGKLNMVFGDVHIYENHLCGAIEQIRRSPDVSIPYIRFKCSEKTPIREYTIDDLELLNYEPQPIIKMKMVA